LIGEGQTPSGGGRSCLRKKISFTKLVNVETDNKESNVLLKNQTIALESAKAGYFSILKYLR